MALRPDPADGARALRPDRVGEDVRAVHLDQHRRMVDEGDAELAHPDPGRGHVGGHLLPIVPVPAFAGDDVQLATERVLDLSILERDVVVEALAVEVVGDRAVIAGRGERRAAGESA